MKCSQAIANYTVSCDDVEIKSNQKL